MSGPDSKTYLISTQHPEELRFPSKLVRETAAVSSALWCLSAAGEEGFQSRPWDVPSAYHRVCHIVFAEPVKE